MITAIIQARMSSTRLPKKVLLPLGDTTILGHTVRQVKKAKKIGRTIVATSIEKEDDAIEVFCKKFGVEVYRGNLEDVLDRYYKAAKARGAEHIARITADCPLIDPLVINDVVNEYEKGDCDYISTGRVNSTFPDGMDTEIFSFTALERAWKDAKLHSEREHVTPYIWNHPELFRVREIRLEKDLSKIRLTVDEQDDYEVVKHIVAHVPELHMDTILEYLSKHREVSGKNAKIIRDAGYFKSLKQDEEKKQNKK